MVEEQTEAGLVINQPAGHLEPNEDLIAAVQRETLEETAHRFKPEALLGVYHYASPHNGITYLRFAFCGSSLGEEAGRKLDPDIQRALWLSREELKQASLRSPMVLRCVEDYQQGRRYPITLLNTIL